MHRRFGRDPRGRRHGCRWSAYFLPEGRSRASSTSSRTRGRTRQSSRSRAVDISFEEPFTTTMRWSSPPTSGSRNNWGAADVVSLVAAARHVRGLLPQRQRPVGSGDHLAVRLPDERPELHSDRRAAVRLPRRHPFPRRARRGPAADRSSAPVQGVRQLLDELGPEPRCRAFSSAPGIPLTPLAANPHYENNGEIPEGPRGSGIETVDGFKTRTPFTSRSTCTPTTACGSARTAALCCSRTCSTCSTRERATGYDQDTESTFGALNPDFGQPVITRIPQFQTPFQIRFGARFEF